MQVVLIAQRPATRCALCHDDIEPRALRCEACGAWLHAECAIPCPTLGCPRGALARRFATASEEPRTGPSRWLRPVALASMTLLVSSSAFWSWAVAGDGEGARSPVERVRSDLRTLHNALNLYRVDTGTSPVTLSHLWARPPGPAGARWRGPYLDGYPRLDPWGRPYWMQLDARGRPRLFSLGADGAPGGEGDAADLWSPRRPFDPEW